METEGRDIYDLAHEMAEVGLMEYENRWLPEIPDRSRKARKEKLIENEISRHGQSTRSFCFFTYDSYGMFFSSGGSCKTVSALRLADGWGGSMSRTEFSDVLFGTPKPIDTEANLGVMVEENKHCCSRT